MIAPSPTPAVGDDLILKFERSRREVDNDPNAWLQTPLQSELVRLGVKNALEASDAEFLYLYGRAKLLTGDNEEAVKAFEAAIARASLDSPQAKRHAQEGSDSRAGRSRAEVRQGPAGRAVAYDELMRQSLPTSSPGSSPSAPASSSSPISPTSSPVRSP